MEVSFGMEEALRAAVGYDTIPYWLIKGAVTELLFMMVVYLIPEQYVRKLMPKKMAYFTVTLVIIFAVILCINDTDPLTCLEYFAGTFMACVSQWRDNSGTSGFCIEFMVWVTAMVLLTGVFDFILKHVHPKSEILTGAIAASPVWAMLINGFCIWNDISVITFAKAFGIALAAGMNFGGVQG